MSVAKNVLPRSISMHIPLGLKKGRGRPRKAVKGALNRQNKIKPINPDTYEDLNEDEFTQSEVTPLKGIVLHYVFLFLII